LLLHHAALPSPLNHAQVSKFAADFVDHGLPALALDVLLADDHSITLAFVGTMRRSQKAMLRRLARLRSLGSKATRRR